MAAGLPPRRSPRRHGSWCVPIPAPVLWKHFAGIDRIGKARIDEDVGSDLFARTASTGAAVLASVLSAGPDLKHLKPVRTVLQGFRGYALGLWSLVHLITGRSRVGLRLVSLAVPLGTALLALSLVAPGFPGAVAVVGLVIMLAGLTTALLLNDQSAALRRRIRRLAFATVSVVAIVALVGWRYHDVLAPRLGWIRAWKPSDNVMRALVVIVAMGSWRTSAASICRRRRRRSRRLPRQARRPRICSPRAAAASPAPGPCRCDRRTATSQRREWGPGRVSACPGPGCAGEAVMAGGHSTPRPVPPARRQSFGSDFRNSVRSETSASVSCSPNVLL